MATKVRDYKKLAADIKDTLGESNILSATHCATRLRLVLKENPPEEIDKKISQMPAVIQIVRAGGQYQIVIGTHAKDVYEHLSGMMTFSEDAPKVQENPLNIIVGVMSGCVAPFVYILAAAGLLQGCLIIIKLIADLIMGGSAGTAFIGSTGAGQIYDMISWTPFTFLPAFIAVAGSRHFKCNTFIALWCCLALTNPTWAGIAAAITAGTPLHFLFVPLFGVTYTSTVIPPIICVACLAWLEPKIDKAMPEVLKAIGTPFCCTAIMVPLTIMVIGPVSTVIANALAAAYNILYSFLPWLASGILGAVWQVLVIFGVHWSFTPISLANFANDGFDLLQPCMAIAVCAQTAACFGAFVKSKNADVKNVAASAAATGLFGITEPAIYGITLRFKKPFICGCIGAAIGSMIASFFGTRYFVYAGLAGFLTIPNAIFNADAQANVANLYSGDASGFSAGVIGLLIGTAVACAIAFILVQVIGFDDPVEIQEDEEEEAAAPAVSDTKVYAPLTGEVVDLQQVPDETFAGGVLGQGLAIVPSEGKLYSPVDGRIDAVFDSKHAISIFTDTGAEMLIHVGLETVELKGQYFKPVVKTGDKVRKGDLLMEFDLDAIRQKYKTFTPVLITNADEYSAIEPVKTSGEIKAGEPLYTAKA